MKSQIPRDERFLLWELADSLNSKEQPVSFLELYKQFQQRTGVLFYFGDLPGERQSWILRAGERKTICAQRPEDAATPDVLRRWFQDVASDMFYCLDGRSVDDAPAGDYQAPRPFDEERASCFAHALASQWNGTYSSRFPRTSEAREIDFPVGSDKLLSVIRQLRHARVLILGKYPGEGGRRLREIELALQRIGLTPTIFGDLRGCDHLVAAGRVREEVLTVAKLSDLVIVEDSEPSGHLLELADLGGAMVTTAILRLRGYGSTILAESFWRQYGAFMRLFEYSPETLDEVINEVVEWHKSVQ